MRVLIVFDHPYTRAASENVPHNRSFAAASAASVELGLARAGHEVDLIDLHADGFDPVMSAADLAAWRMKSVLDPQVLDYQRRLFAADHVVFLFPVWWEAMPAMTKGFFDRVLTKGIVYEEPRPMRPFVNKLTRLRGVTVVSVMSTPPLIYRWWFGNPLTKIAFRGTFRKIGVGNLRWVNISGVADQPMQRRERTLHAIEERFAALR
ncbi:NAD(P)H-dependent oxidoreductase [Microbacterium sp.]|uniref:NAD(P)H-dependent oxidoreductase n=1 Tax=Microbacterium sp. TaxID=51671 RepID=UPI002FE18280